MSQLEKAKKRLLSTPKDYSYDEAKKLLEKFGYIEYNKGKTSGSRIKFYKKETKEIIMFHKPHPGNIMKKGVVNYLRDYLFDRGYLDE